MSSRHLRSQRWTSVEVAISDTESIIQQHTYFHQACKYLGQFVRHSLEPFIETFSSGIKDFKHTLLHLVNFNETCTYSNEWINSGNPTIHVTILELQRYSDTQFRTKSNSSIGIFWGSKLWHVWSGSTFLTRMPDCFDDPADRLQNLDSSEESACKQFFSCLYYSEWYWYNKKWKWLHNLAWNVWLRSRLRLILISFFAAHWRV